MPYENSLKNSIIEHSRRLQRLKEQQARLGADSPPEILSEIEDTETRIAQLQTELEALEVSANETHIREAVVIIPSPTSRLVFSRQGKRRIYSREYFDTLYQLIVDAIGSYNPRIHCQRSFSKSARITSDIIRSIAEADIAIAVVTGRSSIIFWQLGIRHALRKGTLILQDREDESPLGLVGYAAHQYQLRDSDGVQDLTRLIQDKLGVYDDAFPGDSPVHNILGQDLTELIDIGFNRIDLFVSYSSKYLEEGMTIAQKAQERNLSVFLDRKDIEYGSIFSEDIRYNLLRSRELCILVTPEALDSEWVITEWGAAWVLRKTITPILLRCSETQLPERLRAYQCVDFHNIEEYLDQVARRRFL